MADQNLQPMQAEAMEGGFKDAVFNSQLVFDRLMNVMARPGTIVELPELAAAPSPVFASASALMAALCDSDTTLYFEPIVVQNRLISDWVAFHTGAEIVGHPADCMFALITDLPAFSDLSVYSKGSQEYPDRSSTIIVQVASLHDGESYILSGPGIETTTTVTIPNLPLLFLDQWTVNRGHYPRGVDIIFVTDNSMMCLPRTTQMIRGEA